MPLAETNSHAAQICYTQIPGDFGGLRDLIAAATIRQTMDGDAMTVLTEFPGAVAERPEVARVVIFPARAARKHRIIHLCNWHMIPRKYLQTALKADGVADEEIERRFTELRARVQSVQDEQYSLMLFLVGQLGLSMVHLEGLCPDDVAGFLKRLEQIRTTVLEETEDSAGHSSIEDVREDRLLAGVIGRMAMEGILEVLPAEDRSAFEAANPMHADGSWYNDPEAMERRETAIVNNLILAGTITFVVLGGLHDLSDNVPDDCEYIRIETRRYTDRMARNKTGTQLKSHD